MIRSSKHTIKFTNSNKQNSLNLLFPEFKTALSFYVDYLWSNKTIYGDKVFSVSENLLDCPSFISTVGVIDFKTKLSARILKCVSTQACGMVKAATEKRRKQLYILDKLKSENKKISKGLLDSIKKPLVKPGIPDNVYIELNSLCVDFEESNKEFNGFIQLKSLGKAFGKIRIPIKFHKQSNKWRAKGKLKSSFLISKDEICFRWEIPEVKKRSKGTTLGADQGVKTALTLSDSQITPRNKHNHDLYSINSILSRKKKGSKAFRRTQEHRENYVNWSVKQLNFSGVKQVNIEDISNLRKGKRTNRFLSHFAYTLIQDKLEALAEEEGFLIKLSTSVYRSQRCSNCGLVRESNRKSKEYNCECGFSCDSDLNAALNHSLELYELPFDLRLLKLNKEGFFWKTSGIFSLSGQELIVPDAIKSNENC